MYRLKVIGTQGTTLGARETRELESCRLVVATERLQTIATGNNIPCQPLTPLNEAFTSIHQNLETGDVAILASGDPLFYGIGKRLIEEFGASRLQFFPALTSLQRACARWQLPWDDAAIVSLHGRHPLHLPTHLLAKAKCLILTDHNWRPERIAAVLHDYLSNIGGNDLLEEITMLIAEDLDTPSEKVSRGRLGMIAEQTFSPLNVVGLLVPRNQYQLSCRFGLHDDEIHHSRGLITKNEVRAATLHHLRLPAIGTLWDIGGGSGSVGLEAARLLPDLTVYSIEQNPVELANIKKNVCTFGCFNLVPLAGRAPAALAGLPKPDRIFVGGSGGALPEIVAYAGEVLEQGARLVINGVLPKTIAAGQRLMREHGFSVTTSTVQVRRTNAHGESRDLNPITIMTGIR
jgi:precorrin-6Y C5,15-methyltransferase (decarboxylating)